MILRSNDPNFNSYIENITNQDDFIPSIYTFNSLKYYKQKALDDGKNVIDKSFIFFSEGKPHIAFIGAKIESEKSSNIIAYEIPSIVYMSSSSISKKIIKNFIDEFEKNLIKLKSRIVLRDFLQDGSLSPLSIYLLNNGGFARPYYTQIIDLKKESSIKKSNIRKSFSSLINWGMSELEPKVYSSKNFTWEEMEKIRILHIHESGRETRSVDSWKRQFEMVLSNKAFVVSGTINNQLVSAGFFPSSKNYCFYGFSASRRDLFNKPLFHALLWTAILHAKKIGCSFFELGERIFPKVDLNSSPTEKELSISSFKMGFGGMTYTQLLVELDLSIQK